MEVTTGNIKCAVRSSPVSQNEKECLLGIIKDFLDIINDRSTSFAAVSRKATVWQDIATRFNNATGYEKTSTQVRKIWENIRNRAKKEYFRVKYEWNKTGGVPPPMPLDTWSSQVLSMIERRELEPPEYHWDSDAGLQNELEESGQGKCDSQSNTDCISSNSNNGEEVPVDVSPGHVLNDNAAAADPPSPPQTPPPQKGPEVYQIRHNNHLTVILDALAQDESFMDVTLTAQGQSLKAHKSVLSAVSPYFRGVLRDNPCQHPIVIMPRDVRFEELFSIITYIYRGEMTIAAEDVTSLLKTAEILQVSGLVPCDSTAVVKPHTESSVHEIERESSATSVPSSNQSVLSRLGKTVQVAAVQSITTREGSINPADYIHVDMAHIKEEFASAGEEEHEEPSSNEKRSTPLSYRSVRLNRKQQLLLQTHLSHTTMQEQASPSSSSSHDPVIGKCIRTDSEKEKQSQTVAVGEGIPPPHTCPYCQEHHKGSSVMISHLRLKHPTNPSFLCKCGRVFVRHFHQQMHVKSCQNS